jgi:chemotaxis protein MotB
MHVTGLARVMGVLLAVAVLAACTPVAGPPPPPESRYQVLSRALQSEVAADQAQIAQLEGRLKITLVNSLMFSDGGWDLTDDGKQTLDKIVPMLKSAASGHIQVDGFTDNIPIGMALRRTFGSNWQLSSARADAVVQYLTAQGVDGDMLVAAGYGETRPVAPNTTAAGRARNRRIEISLVGG